MLTRASFTAHVSQDINATVWEKLAFNAALNAIGMICQVANEGVDNDESRRIAINVVDEAVSVATAKQIELDRDRIVATVLAALSDHGHHKASMLQDRDHGRPTEIEMINGAIAREGTRLRVPTPVCDTLTDLVRIIERSSRSDLG